MSNPFPIGSITSYKSSASAGIIFEEPLNDSMTGIVGFFQVEYIEIV